MDNIYTTEKERDAYLIVNTGGSYRARETIDSSATRSTHILNVYVCLYMHWAGKGLQNTEGLWLSDEWRGGGRRKEVSGRNEDRRRDEVVNTGSGQLTTINGMDQPHIQQPPDANRQPVYTSNHPPFQPPHLPPTCI